MEKRVDARGLKCPMPVIKTKKELEATKSGNIITIVDNEVAKENINKLAKGMGYEVDITEKNGEYYINILKDIDSMIEEELDNKYQPNNTSALIICIGKNYLGEGSKELGEILMKGYVYTLTEATKIPKEILLINSGVKLAINNSDVLNHLKDLEKKGTKIVSCGTCLDYFNLKDELGVGSIGNMYDIVESLNSGKNTIVL